MKTCVLLILGLAGACRALDIPLKDIQTAVAALWKADTNRADPGQQFRVDYQDHTSGGARVDNAPDDLFRYVDPALLRKPTYQALIDLFDAYSTSSPSAAQIKNFLDKISATSVYTTLQAQLAANGYQPAKSDSTFRAAMAQIWFGDYGRSGSGQSSGFEHVFIGEVKNGQVSGLHNWVRMYYLEQKGKLDYTGFIIKRPRVAMLQYKMGDAWKPTGSVLFGTSPEFDLAIFTLCFLGKQGESKCQFFLGDCTPIDVSSYPYTVRGTVFIGTVYPSPWNTKETCPLSSSG